jgi:hypothetical protein
MASFYPARDTEKYGGGQKRVLALGILSLCRYNKGSRLLHSSLPRVTVRGEMRTM